MHTEKQKKSSCRRRRTATTQKKKWKTTEQSVCVCVRRKRDASVTDLQYVSRTHCAVPCYAFDTQLHSYKWNYTPPSALLSLSLYSFWANLIRTRVRNIDSRITSRKIGGQTWQVCFRHYVAHLFSCSCLWCWILIFWKREKRTHQMTERTPKIASAVVSNHSSPFPCFNSTIAWIR